MNLLIKELSQIFIFLIENEVYLSFKDKEIANFTKPIYLKIVDILDKKISYFSCKIIILFQLIKKLLF